MLNYVSIISIQKNLKKKVQIQMLYGVPPKGFRMFRENISSVKVDRVGYITLPHFHPLLLMTNCFKKKCLAPIKLNKIVCFCMGGTKRTVTYGAKTRLGLAKKKIMEHFNEVMIGVLIVMLISSHTKNPGFKNKQIWNLFY